MARRVVSLSPGTLELTGDYPNILRASKAVGVRRQRIYQALRTGQLCKGLRWLRYEIWLKSQKQENE